MQNNLGLKELKLKQDVVTRWNSTFEMLQRLLMSKEAIISSLVLLDSSRCTLQNVDWEIIEQSVCKLQLFHDVTIEISSEKQISLSKTSILTQIMERKLRQETTSNRKVSRLISELADGLDSRFGGRESNDLIAQAIILDPHFKKQGFSDEKKYRTAYQSLVHTMQTFPSTPDTVPAASEINSFPKTEQKSCLWQQFDEFISNSQGAQDPTSVSTIELDKYLAEPHLLRTSDPLVWWESRKHVYPTLYQVMLMRLCIPATSVPCERVFSKAGQLISERRSRLTGKHVEQIMFVNGNCN